MAHLKLVVMLNMVSGIPEDRPVNTFHFECDDPSAGSIAILADLPGWYDEVANILAGSVEQDGHFAKIYNMASPEPRAPIADVNWDLSILPNGAPLPSETCLCLSFQGNRVSGVAQASRRGRVYIGPLDTGNIGSDGRPSSVAVNAVVDMGTLMLADSTASADYTWSVYSPTMDELVTVSNGWVDNAYDTQRRRGLASTARTVWS